MRSQAKLGSIGLCLVAVTTWASASNLEGAVKVGDRAVPPASVEHALSDCNRHAPEVAPVKCLDTYFVPRWLLDREVGAKGLREEPSLQHLLGDLLHRALVSSLFEKVGAPSDQGVDAYLKKHARDFEKPLRIRIFRILLDSEQDAKKLLEELKPDTSIETFRKLARDHSVDRATNERGGDLGFVWPDGSTDVPQVSADEVLYARAAELEDGEIAREPISEGPRFAIIWRRGSLPAVRPDEASRELARRALQEEKTEMATMTLLKKLESRVSSRNDDLLGKLRRKEATLFREP